MTKDHKTARKLVNYTKCLFGKYIVAQKGIYLQIPQDTVRSDPWEHRTVNSESRVMRQASLLIQPVQITYYLDLRSPTRWSTADEIWTVS